MKENENENRIGYYSVISATVLYNKELKANEKLLYAITTSLACKEGYCFASNEYLAEKLGVNRKNSIKLDNTFRGEKIYNPGYEGRDYPDEFFESLYANSNVFDKKA